jgi:hypothetical protein
VRARKFRANAIAEIKNFIASRINFNFHQQSSEGAANGLLKIAFTYINTISAIKRCFPAIQNRMFWKSSILPKTAKTE